MLHDFAPKLAHLVTHYCVPVEKGDFVIIDAAMDSLPLMQAIAASVLERGGIPEMRVGVPHWKEYFAQNATEEQLAFVNPISQAVLKTADVLFNIDAPAHTNPMASIKPERMAQVAAGSAKVRESFNERLGKGMRWSLSAWPTPARAQQANMGFYTYQRFVYEAYALHTDNPIAYWEALAERQARYVDWLMARSHLHVKAPGIDLQLDYDGRNWYSAHGNANFPDGEILCCPLEASVNGTVAFNNPAYYAGKKVQGVRLTFKDGVVTDASADDGEEFLLEMLDMDDNARRLGEFAIGTNEFIQRVTGSTLFDEKIGGTIHMALGQSAAPHEGKNPSQIHWDIVHDLRQGGEIVVDGDLLHKDGKFVI